MEPFTLKRMFRRETQNHLLVLLKFIRHLDYLAMSQIILLFQFQNLQALLKNWPRYHGLVNLRMGIDKNLIYL